MSLFNLITGAIQGITGMNASNSANRAAERSARSQERLTDAQIQELLRNQPFLDALRAGGLDLVNPMIEDAMGEYKSAQAYDPHLETERALGAFDAAANESVARDYGNARVPLSLRGMGKSSERTGGDTAVAAARSTARGRLASDLTLGEGERREARRGRAADRLSRAFSQVNPISGSTAVSNALAAPASSLNSLANMRLGQAQSFDPTGPINMIGSGINNLSFLWRRRNNSSGSNSNGASSSGNLPQVG